MALIGRIRRNSWILIVFLGFALAAFVVMDLFSGSNKYGVSNLSLGQVDGEKIDYREFNEMQEVLYGGASSNTYASRNALWNFFLNNKLIAKEADAIGLGVTKEEMTDLQFGQNPSPIIFQRFANPQTGQLDFQRLQQIKQMIEGGQLTDPQQRQYWAYQEKEIMTDRLESKIGNLIGKSFHTPDWMAQRLNVDQTQKVDFSFVKFAFDEMQVPENEITVTDGEIRQYLKDNRGDYYQEEETRTSRYVAFTVEATASDSADIYQELVEVKEDFESTENDTVFLEGQDGEFWSDYRFQDILSEAYAEDVFSADIGTIMDPVQVDGQYQVIKVMDRKVVPDSVRSRHILRSATTQAEYGTAYRTIDSLKNLIENEGFTFDSLASAYGQDGTATRGGDLGFAGPGMMVKQFNDKIFFQAEPNELEIVITEFGVHLVEVTDRKYIERKTGVQLGIVSRDIIPSQETQDSVYSLAQKLISENRSVEALEESARSLGLRLQLSNPLKEQDFTFGLFGSGSESREIVKWLFDAGTSEGDVSPVVYTFQDPELYYTKNMVVLGLNEIIPEGMPDLEDVKFRVEPILRNEKKAQIFVQQNLNQITDVADIAQSRGKQVQKASGVSFYTDVINNVGDEPKVVAAARQLEEGRTSIPIIGRSGVFVIEVTSKPGLPETANYAAVKQQNDQTLARQAKAAIMKSLKDGANIQDDRSKYF